MEKRIEDVMADLAKIAEDAKQSFGPLSAQQLNWKPAAKSWSIAQCLDHVITTHSLYFPLLQRLADGSAKPSLLERFSPFSGWWGRLLLKIVSPENESKVKTTAKAEPSASEIDGQIVQRFAEHQAEMVEQLRRLPKALDPATTIITSPLLAIATYSLDVAFTIFVAHSRRHLDQAGRVTEAEGFPAG